MAQQSQEAVGEKAINAKTLFGDIKKIKKGMEDSNEKRKDLFVLYGVATAMATGMGKHGEWYALLGEFEAVNLVDGTTHRSMKCFLPKDITAYFGGIIKGDSKNVEFGVKVGIKLVDNTVGYEYTTQQLTPTKESAAVNKLRDEMAKHLPETKKTGK